MAEQTLLEKAIKEGIDIRAPRSNTPIFPEDQLLELAVAYANRKIDSGAAQAAMGIKGNVIQRLSNSLMTGVRHGKVKIL